MYINKAGGIVGRTLKRYGFLHLWSIRMTLILRLNLAWLAIIEFETALLLLWVHVYISIITHAVAFLKNMGSHLNK